MGPCTSASYWAHRIVIFIPFTPHACWSLWNLEGTWPELHPGSLSLHSFIYPSEPFCLSISYPGTARTEFVLTYFSASRRMELTIQKLRELLCYLFCSVVHSLADSTSFCPFVTLLVIVIPLTCSLDTLVLITKGEMQHRNFHAWCFILCGLPEGTALWLCLHSQEINVPYSDSFFLFIATGL